MKQINFLIKLNSYGIYFVSVLIGFVIYTGFSSLLTTNYDFQYIQNKDFPEKSDDNVRHLYLFGENPSLLAGSLTLGYFSHSFILSLMKTNEVQENNKRDLFYGYLLVCLTYTLIGLLGYVGFSGANFDAEFKDNWFVFFSADNIFILFLRLLSVIQLCSIFPILFYIVRIQFFGTFYQNNYPSKKHIVGFSLMLLFLCIIVLYFFYNSLGTLMSVIGAATGLVLIYFIPLIVNIVYYREKHPSDEKRKEYLNMIQQENNNDKGLANDLISDGDVTLNTVLVKSEKSEKAEKNNLNNYQNFSELFNGPRKVSKKPESKFINTLFYISQFLLMACGIFTLIIQFVKINFFNIHLKSE